MKSQPGNNSAGMGAQAKRMFNQLVPFAKRATAEQYIGCRYFDVNGVVVAVKYITPSTRGSWVFVPAPNETAPDFYVLFCGNQRNSETLGVYDLYLIPHNMIATSKSVQFRRGLRNPFTGNIVDPAELASIFE